MSTNTLAIQYMMTCYARIMLCSLQKICANGVTHRMMTPSTGGVMKPESLQLDVAWNSVTILLSGDRSHLIQIGYNQTTLNMATGPLKKSGKLLWITSLRQ